MATANQVSQLFVALYNRAPDGTIAQRYAGQAYNQSLIRNVINENPQLTNYSNQTFVEMLYKNALGKDNSNDKAGIDYWVSQANNNGWTKEQIVESFLQSIDAWKLPQNMRDPDGNPYSQAEQDLAAQGRLIFNAKVGIAEQAATTIGGNVSAGELTFGNGLAEITTQNYNTEYEKAIQTTVAAIAARNPLRQSGGETVTLGRGEGAQTTFAPAPESGADTNLKYATDFDDVINASVTGAPQTTTFLNSTVIDAGKGYDTLKIDMSADFEFANGRGGVSNVERVELTNTTGVANQAVTFDASGIQGATAYSLNGINGVNLTNVAFDDFLLVEMNGIKNAASTGSTLDGGQTRIDFTKVPAGGTLFLNLNGVGYDSLDVDRTNHEVSLGVGIGVLNINLTGENFVDFTSDQGGIKNLTIGGNGTLNTNLHQGITYFNASASKGDLIVKATDPALRGSNGDNVFTHFSTGTGDDKVTLDVSRLDQNATVDLGTGNDTLTIQGKVDFVARQNFYNLNTVENLVFATTGEPLLLDLGTKFAEPEAPSEDEVQDENYTPPTPVPTADRSANLQSITFADAANVQLTGLGTKPLTVDYKGATQSQKVLVDTSGDINLILGGVDKTSGFGDGTGEGVEGAGLIRLSETNNINLSLTGRGFSGHLSASKATKLNIVNTTGNQKLALLANTDTEKNDLGSLETITINTEAQNAAGDVASINLAAATLPSLKAVTMTGVGDVTFGDIDTRNNLTFDGTQYSGKLTLGNVSAKKPGTGSVSGSGIGGDGLYGGQGVLNIATKGAISTGTLTGNNITIDLRKNIEVNSETLTNNDIGTIFVSGDSGSLTYITGYSGTVGAKTTDAQGNDTTKQTQEIVVTSKDATIQLDGLTGVDSFDITASSATKTLTISGSLGAANPDQIANGNYDSVRIDLSNTTGATLNIANLDLYNPTGTGIVIAPSKGADNISLSNNINEVIEFSAGGGATAIKEEYTLDLGNVRLGQNQSITIDGLTITNANASGNVMTATDILAVLKLVTEGEAESGTFKTAANGFVGTTAKTLASAGVVITGTLESLTGEWAGATGGITGASAWTARVSAGTAPIVDTAKIDGTTFTITAANAGNLTDLKIADSIKGNGNAAEPTTLTAEVTVGRYGAGTTQISNANHSASGSAVLFEAQAIDSGDAISTFTFDLNGSKHSISFRNMDVGGSNEVTAGTIATTLRNLLTGGTATGIVAFGSDKCYAQVDGSEWLTSASAYAGAVKAIQDEAASFEQQGIFFAVTDTAKVSMTTTGLIEEDLNFSFSQIGQSTGDKTGDFLVLGATSTPVRGKIVVDFGEGLKAGQSYTFNDKTVLATKDLTGNEVARAFTYGVGESFDGAVIMGSATTWAAGGSKIDATKALFSVENSTLTIIDNALATANTDVVKNSNGGILGKAESFVTGTEAAGVDVSMILGNTTVQGQQQSQPAADSYVSFANVVDFGAAPVAGTTDATNGKAASFGLVQRTLDTISNFDTTNDKLQLHKFDPANAAGKGDKYEYANILSDGAISFGSGSATQAIYIDANGSTLSASAENGIISFSATDVSGNAISDANITLEQKLYVATHFLGDTKIAGFEHASSEGGSGADFYVIATGANANTTTDDLVIKLAGVANVSDIATILA